MRISFTIAGLPHQYSAQINSPKLSNSEKKRLRLNLCQQLPPNAIPFHAAILQNQHHSILISGASKAGKSTLAETLTKKHDYKILANDFVILWIKNGQIMAGDLNLKNQNRNKKAVKIKHLICLSPNDKRDIFRFTNAEFASFYGQSLPEIPNKLLSKFKKTQVFSALKTKHFALGNRQTPSRWHKILVSQLTPTKPNKIGIVGMGTIGQSISNLLLTQPWVKQLHLFSTNQNKLHSIKMDLDSAKPPFPITVHNTFKSLASHSNLLILCFKSHKSTKAHGNERFQRLIPNTEIVWQLSRYFRKQDFDAKIIMVSNPVDFLSWMIYYLSNHDDNFKLDWQGLSSHQILGVGLGLDHARLNTITNKALKIIGEHGNNGFLCTVRQRTLYPTSQPRILASIRDYSPQIRKHLPRTVFGPTHEILHIAKTINSAKENILMVSQLNVVTGFFTGNVFNYHNHFLVPKYNKSAKLICNLQKLKGIYDNYQNNIVKHLKKNITTISTSTPQS